MTSNSNLAPIAVTTAFACLFAMTAEARSGAPEIPAALVGNSCPAASATGAVRSPHIASGIDRVFAGLVRSDGPGAMVAVVRHGQVLHLQGYGLADPATGSRWTSQMRYRLASITKTFTATAVLELADREYISLDAPVTRYLPELSAAAGNIRVRDLLTMSSGLWQDEDLMDMTGNALVASSGASARHMSVPDMAAYAAIQDQLDFRPGTVFRYVDTNFRLLARVIEKVTGKSFAVALQELVLAPARMPYSAPYPALDSVFACQVPTYVQSGGHWKDIGVYALAASGDGAMISTMNDMISWTRYMSATGDDGRPSRYVRQADPENRIARPGAIYRLGIMMFRHRGYTALGHQGATGTLFVFVPDLELAIVIFTNGLDGGLSMSGRNRNLAAQVIDVIIESFGSTALPPPSFAVSASAVPLQRAPLPSGVFPAGTFLCESSGEVLDMQDRGDRTQVALMGESLGSWIREDASRWLGMDSHLQLRMSAVPQPLSGGAAIEVQEVNSDTGCRFTALVPQSLSSDEASELAGWYYTDVLKTFYRIGIADGGPYLAAGSDIRPDARRSLTRLSGDVLRAGPLVVRLLRSSTGRVTGFSVSTGRVRNVPFHKLKV